MLHAVKQRHVNEEQCSKTTLCYKGTCIQHSYNAVNRGYLFLPVWDRNIFHLVSSGIRIFTSGQAPEFTSEIYLSLVKTHVHVLLNLGFNAQYSWIWQKIAWNGAKNVCL
jgi:ABC-type sulfate transport system permease subunit